MRAGKTQEEGEDLEKEEGRDMKRGEVMNGKEQMKKKEDERN